MQNAIPISQKFPSNPGGQTHCIELSSAKEQIAPFLHTLIPSGEHKPSKRKHFRIKGKPDNL